MGMLFCMTLSVSGQFVDNFIGGTFEGIRPREVGTVENGGEYTYKVKIEDVMIFNPVSLEAAVEFKIRYNASIELSGTVNDIVGNWATYFSAVDDGLGEITFTQIAEIPLATPVIVDVPFKVLKNEPVANLGVGMATSFQITSTNEDKALFFNGEQTTYKNTVAPCPTLIVDEVICDGATYSVKFTTDAHDISDNTYFTFSAGTLDAANNMITGVPRGTDLVITADNNNNCQTPITVSGGTGNCPTECETPDLSLSQTVCTTGGYTFTFTETTGATITTSPTTGVTIDLATNTITVADTVDEVNVIATNSPDCIVDLKVTKPTDCGTTEPCNLSPIAVSAPFCSPGLADTYRIPFVLHEDGIITAPTTGIVYTPGSGDKQGYIEVASGTDIVVKAKIDGNDCPDEVEIPISGKSCPQCELTATSVVTRASCNVADGKIEVTIENTVSPTYAWTLADGSAIAGATTDQANLENVEAGNYKLTVTDGSCVLEHFVTLEKKPECNNPPNCDIEVSYTASDMSCTGDDGSIDVTATGSGNLTYAWTAEAGGEIPAGTTTASSSLSNLKAGVYTVVVSSDIAAGCNKTVVIKVTDGCGEECDLEVVVDVTQVDCSNTGQLKANVTGGIAPYTIEWKNKDTNAVAFTGAVFNLTDANAGEEYYVEVTDNEGCEAGLAAAAAIEIVDTCGCELAATSIVTPTNCADDELTGKVVVSVANASASATYVWTRTDGGTIPVGVATNSATLENVGEGSYKLTISDGPTCSLEHFVNVEKKPECNNPANCDIELTYQASDVSCDGNDGSVTLDVTSTGNLTFAWTATDGGVVPTGQEDDQNLTGLVNGTYAVVVTSDASADCNETYTIKVNDGCKDECNLETSIDVEQLDCAGNGMLRASVSGGIAPFTITWRQNGNPGFSQTGATLTLTAADKDKEFYVEVTDSKGCLSGISTSEAITIVDDCQCQVAATSVVTPTDCSTATGVIDLSVTNASATATFAWTNADGTPIGGTVTVDEEDISGLDEGSYKVVIKDGDNCEIEYFVNVDKKPECNNPPNCNLELTYEVSDMTCAGDDGSVTVNVTGDGNYTFAWTAADGGVIQAGQEDDQNLTGLTKGSYTLTVSSDVAAGCSKSITVKVEDGCKDECNLQAVVDVEQIDCAGNGALKASVSGGIAPFTITWKEKGNATFSQTGATLTLTSTDINREFYVEVTDAKGCTSGLIESEAIVITDDCGCQLSATSIVTPTDCNTNNGMVDLTVSGETPSSFLWTMADGSALPAGVVNNQEDLTNVGEGNYKVVIKGDDADCELVQYVSVEKKPECNTPIGCDFEYTYEAFDMTCAGDDGQINITASGSGTLSYAWTAADGGEIPAGTNTTTASLIGLKAGTYTVEISSDVDANCKEEFTVEINDGCKEECNLQVVVDVEQVSCDGEGVLKANVSGGLGNYVIEWRNQDGDVLEHTGAVFNLTSANVGEFYYVTVKDDKNCETGITSGAAIKIEDECGCQLSFNSKSNEVSCFVNDGSIELFVEGYSALANVSITVKNAAGETQTLSGALTEDTTANIVEGLVENLAEGNYTITITDDKGDADGTNDCEDEFIVNLDKKDECIPKQCTMDVAGETFNVSCAGDDGGVSLTVNDPSHVDNLSYNWIKVGDPTVISGSKDLVGIGLADIGTYQVTITDNLGDGNPSNDCIEILQFEIKDGCTPECNLSVNVEVENCEGNLIASVANGVGPYDYKWFDESDLTTAVHTEPVFAGVDTSITYKLVVTDEGAVNACSKELTGIKIDETKCSPDYQLVLSSENGGVLTIGENQEINYFIDITELNDNNSTQPILIRVLSPIVSMLSYDATATSVTSGGSNVDVDNQDWTYIPQSANTFLLRYNKGIFSKSGTSKITFKVKENPAEVEVGNYEVGGLIFGGGDQNIGNNSDDEPLTLEK